MTIFKKLRREHFLFALILTLALASRFIGLGTRTMSHDETQHTYFSWLFYKGLGYTHTPLTHGPLQFHLMALSYGLFGDTDTAARIPHATFSVLTVAAVWLFRRRLGKYGTPLAALMLTISPYLLYYGRYARNEALVGLFGLLSWWAVFDYLETGRRRALFVLTAATALHFTAKETAFIYTAQLLLFLGLLFLWEMLRRPWEDPQGYRAFLFALGGGGLAALLGVGFALLGGATPLSRAALGLSLLLGAAALFLLGRGLGWNTLRETRSFSLLLLLFSLILPMLAPFPAAWLGFDALDYSQAGMLRTTLVIIPLILAAVALGNWWNPGLWVGNAALFYGIFAVFYTSVFTYGAGFFTGLVGSLGYWLQQQGVQRGSQPWYYYLLIQVPIYEYLPLLASMIGAWYIARRTAHGVQGTEYGVQGTTYNVPGTGYGVRGTGYDVRGTAYFPLFLLYWSLTSLLAYTAAGEKMPWLTYHIALPMVLLGGWALGKLIERIDWDAFRRQYGLPVLFTIPLFALSLAAAQSGLMQWRDLAANRPVALTGALVSLLFAIFSGLALLRWMRSWDAGQTLRLLTLASFTFLGVLTARTAFTAAYLHADYPTEFLVYAHSAPANKRLYHELQDISRRLYGDLSIKVAYDNSDGKGDPGAAWPLSWYLRNFPNTLGFGPEPPTDLRSYDVVVVSDVNWDKVDPLLRRQYDVFEVNRMWWPMQDYFDLTWERIRNALSNPQMRSALFQIWLNRDYTLYGQATGKDLHPPVWDPARKMRVYIRKDISARLWGETNPLGEGAAPPESGDPYEAGRVSLPPQKVVTHPEMVNPRGVAVAPDGSLYVSDIGANRIFHFDSQGNLLGSWGQSGSSEAEPAPPGAFSEPWGVAVGPDGSVYVADTWNHRVQKFTAEGEFVTAWGYFGQGEAPDAFWGPRDVAVDAQGRVFVSDTGNKRVVIFDADGQPLSQTTAGFDEPVGIALSPDGALFVADTWNRRVVRLDASLEGIYTPAGEWPIEGWYGQSLDNKPYLTVLSDGRVALTDPEGFRILLFTPEGEFLHTWGEDPDPAIGLHLPVGIAADAQGGLWVADSAAGRVVYFIAP